MTTADDGLAVAESDSGTIVTVLMHVQMILMFDYRRVSWKSSCSILNRYDYIHDSRLDSRLNGRLKAG